MKISGSYTLPVDQQRAYALLQDPDALARALPGCDHLARIGPDEYAMKMKVAIAAIAGLFEGKIRVADQNSRDSFRLIVEGSGKIGFMKGEGRLTLSGDAGQTEVRYEGEVHVGGVIAGVGQRLLDATAKLIIKRFFDKFAGAITAALPPA